MQQEVAHDLGHEQLAAARLHVDNPHGGGGILNLAPSCSFKASERQVALISSMNDEVVRLFYSPGLANCANFDTVDPSDHILSSGPRFYMVARTTRQGSTASPVTRGRALRDVLLGGANIRSTNTSGASASTTPPPAPKPSRSSRRTSWHGTMDQIGP
jgi:hypothetical protein